MRGQLVAALLLTFSAWGCSGSGLSPTAKEALLSLDGTTFVLKTKKRLRVCVENRDGNIRVGLWPGGRMAIAVPVPIQTDGDAAHFYRAVTGEQHPTLKGKLSETYREDYKAFLEGKGW